MKNSELYWAGAVVLVFLLWNGVHALSEKSDVLKHLGTRTPYRFKYNKNDSRIKYPNCEDSKIWMLIRHGTRLPSADNIVGMNTTLKYLRFQILLHRKKGALNNIEIERLEDWTVNITADQEKYLAMEGQDEMILLAERVQKRFPNAVSKIYNNKTFLFRYTATQRTQQSARYFTVGLFDNKKSQNVMFSPAVKKDPVLRFYKHCDRWQKQVKKNATTYREQKLFGNSKLMNKTLESVTKRLGLPQKLNLDDVNLMYKICGYETSWNKHHISPWCYAFDDYDAKVLEYYHDLKHYWMDGYGHNLTYRQACLAIKTMFDNFSSNEGPFATFLFAHSGTLLKTLSHLLLYKPDSHLTANNMQDSRPWKTSDIDCFASNLAFVLYKCKDGDYVLTLHQEKIIKLPMCDKELCPLDHLRKYFHESIFNCDFSDMCSLSPIEN